MMYRAHTARELAGLAEGRLVGAGDADITGIATDSRQVAPGDLFVAIAGDRVDGHQFVAAAATAGATAALVRTDVPGPPARIVVDDTVLALGRIAAGIRNRFTPVLIGVTGSVGKTTTREMIALVAEQRHTVLAGSGNLNTEIGVPLVLARLGPRHEVAVVEMAMRGLGEIRYLAELARPSIGVVTNVGLAHVELTGSIDRTARCKRELLDALPRSGTAVINADDTWCQWMADGFPGRVIRYSVRGDGQVTADGVRQTRDGLSFTLHLPAGTVPVTMAAYGRHLVPNALAAAGAGLALGLSVREIADGLAAFRPGPMRSQLISIRGADIIDDTYNASPVSMSAALALLSDLPAGRRAAVLGSMLELGDAARDAHLDTGAAVAGIRPDLLVTVGALAANIGRGAIRQGLDPDRVAAVESNREAAGVIGDFMQPGDVILIKGSRGAAMEEIIEQLKGGGDR